MRQMRLHLRDCRGTVRQQHAFDRLAFNFNMRASPGHKPWPGARARRKPGLRPVQAPDRVGLVTWSSQLQQLVAQKQRMYRNQENFELIIIVRRRRLWQNDREVNCLFRNLE
jgi:hypothetical protein